MISFAAAGLLQTALAIGLVAALKAWECWVLIFIGIFVFVLPSIVRFPRSAYESWDAHLVGGLTFVFAAWRILETVNDDAG